jgi:cytoskeletal protein RodZ
MTAKNNTSPTTELLPPLAQHRKRGGLTLEQIAESTKISVRFLRAIESEEYATLPGGIFARSYLRQYAAAIGFDEEKLLGRYHEQMGSPERTDPGLFPKPARRAGPKRRSGLAWFRSLSAIRFL